MADVISTGATKHAALSGTAHDRVLLVGADLTVVSITNRSGTGMWATFGLSTSAASVTGAQVPATPVADADGTYYIPANSTRTIDVPRTLRETPNRFAGRGPASALVVAVVGNGNTYSIEGFVSG